MPIYVVVIFLIIILILIVVFALVVKKEKDKIDFFHFMVHRFRSPISIIRWYAELLSDSAVGNLNEKQKEYFAEIYKASEKLNETNDSLLILLQLESNKLSIKEEKVDVNKFIDNILQKLKFKFERHRLQIKKDYPTDQEIIVKTDPKLLGIAFQYLVENAITYTPENGNIDIKISISNKKLLLEIQDDNYSPPKKSDSKLIANSVNSKDMKFSLYLVELIVKKLQGHIGTRIQANKGTTFYITVPF